MPGLQSSADIAMYRDHFKTWHLYQALAFSLRLPHCGI